MKASHAAALALVGWYLIYAPAKPKTGTTDRFIVDRNAALSEWRKLPNWFDCLSDCERLRDYDRGISAKWSNFTEGTAAQAFMAATSTAKCVPMDDPRLKGNAK